MSLKTTKEIIKENLQLKACIELLNDAIRDYQQVIFRLTGENIELKEKIRNIEGVIK